MHGANECFSVLTQEGSILKGIILKLMLIQNKCTVEWGEVDQVL